MPSVQEESEEGSGDLVTLKRFQAIEPAVAGAVIHQEEAVFKPPRGEAITISDVEAHFLEVAAGAGKGGTMVATLDSGDIAKVHGGVPLGDELETPTGSHEVAIVGEVTEADKPMEVVFRHAAESRCGTVRGVPGADRRGVRGQNIIWIQGQKGRILDGRVDGGRSSLGR